MSVEKIKIIEKQDFAGVNDQQGFTAKIETDKGIVSGSLMWTKASDPSPISGIEPALNGVETKYQSDDWKYCVDILKKIIKPM